MAMFMSLHSLQPTSLASAKRNCECVKSTLYALTSPVRCPGMGCAWRVPGLS